MDHSLRRGRPCNRLPAKPRLEALEERCVPSTSATYLGRDTATQGSWQGAYGGAGYAIVGDATDLPGDIKLTTAGTSTYTYADPTHDLRGLQMADDPTNRLEAGWFNYVYGQTTNTFSLDVKVPGTARHPTRVSFYVLDWDGGARAETFTAYDAKTGKQLDGPRAVSAADSRNGVYVSWDVSGKVRFDVTKTAGVSAVVSAVFFGGASDAPPPGGSAAFAQEDDTTNGSWQGVYGAEGYDVYGATPNYPDYADLSMSYGGQGRGTFAASTQDKRALQNPDVPGDRIAVAQYGPDMTLDVNLTDGQTHQVTLYAVDWDGIGRVERFDLYDGTTGALLGSNTVTISSFAAAGKYLSWDVTGHVQIRVTSVAPPRNAVIEGIFFDPGPAGNNGQAAAIAGGGVDGAVLGRLFSHGHHHHDSGDGGLADGDD